MPMKADKPTFQQSGHANRFRERIAGEKKPQSKPRFNTKNPPKKLGETFKKRPAEKQVLQETRTETRLSNASGSGTVNVVIKRTENRAQPYEKKTGALSPRAPEKIKKNRAEEMKVYGEKACLALFKERPESIIRAWSNVPTSHKIGEIFSYLAANKKAYHVVSNEELAKASGSEHHGGLCFLVKKPRTFTLQGYLAIPRKKDALVLLNNVSNAYNLGGIMRTCAIFGITGVITNNINEINNSAAMRVAEGAMEYIRPLTVERLSDGLDQLRQAGYQVVHLSPTKSQQRLQNVAFNAKVVFVLSETDDADLIAKGDAQPNLTPTNPLNSDLNLSVASGILLAHWNNQR